MTDDYSFDREDDDDEPTQAETDSPAVDAFTELMEGEAVEADDAELTIVAPRPEIVDALQNRISAALKQQLKRTPRILHREVQIALANAFLWVANNELLHCDLQTFEANKQAMLNVIGVLGTAIIEARPGPAHLADEAPATEIVQ